MEGGGCFGGEMELEDGDGWGMDGGWCLMCGRKMADVGILGGCGDGVGGSSV